MLIRPRSICAPLQLGEKLADKISNRFIKPSLPGWQMRLLAQQSPKPFSSPTEPALEFGCLRRRELANICSVTSWANQCAVIEYEYLVLTDKREGRSASKDLVQVHPGLPASPITALTQSIQPV